MIHYHDALLSSQYQKYPVGVIIYRHKYNADENEGLSLVFSNES